VILEKFELEKKKFKTHFYNITKKFIKYFLNVIFGGKFLFEFRQRPIAK